MYLGLPQSPYTAEADLEFLPTSIYQVLELQDVGTIMPSLYGVELQALD